MKLQVRNTKGMSTARKLVNHSITCVVEACLRTESCPRCTLLLVVNVPELKQERALQHQGDGKRRHPSAEWAAEKAQMPAVACFLSYQGRHHIDRRAPPSRSQHGQGERRCLPWHASAASPAVRVSCR